MVVFYCNNDISKFNYIKYEVDILLLMKFKKSLLRDVIFKEAILSFLGVNEKKERLDKYCKLCKSKDCANCELQEVII